MSSPKTSARSRESLLHDLRRVQDLIDRHDYNSAVELALNVRTESKRTTGRDSANAAWLACVAADSAGDAEAALGFVNDALAIDPVCLVFANSFDIVVGHLRDGLVDEGREADDPSIERVYGLLMQAGRVDVDCHLAMVRHYVATGRRDEAFKLVDAVTELFPACAAAWSAKAAIARDLGNEALARDCELEMLGRVKSLGGPAVTMPVALA